MKLTSTLGTASRIRGFTLVELMIAIVIGLFITGGLLTLVQAMKRTTVTQAGLSNLQDNERMAMSLITNVVQSAGFYPNPMTNSTTTQFPAVATGVNYTANQTLAAGQTLSGTHSASAPGDALVARYATLGGDTVLSCTGATSSVAKSWTATLSIDTTNNNNNLQCIVYDSVLGTTSIIPLVNGVENMQVLYGVKTSGSTLYNSADTYLTATQVQAGSYWPAVKSVKVTLSFTNPLKGQPGQTTVGTTIQLTRVITVMNATGVDT